MDLSEQTYENNNRGRELGTEKVSHRYLFSNLKLVKPHKLILAKGLTSLCKFLLLHCTRHYCLSPCPIIIFCLPSSFIDSVCHPLTLSPSSTSTSLPNRIQVSPGSLKYMYMLKPIVLSQSSFGFLLIYDFSLYYPVRTTECGR